MFITIHADAGFHIKSSLFSTKVNVKAVWVLEMLPTCAVMFAVYTPKQILF